MSNNPAQLWGNCLYLIQQNVTEQQFKTWFQPIEFESYNPSTLTLVIKVPSQFIYEYLEENYVDLLGKVLKREFGMGAKLTYHVVTDSSTGAGPNIESDTTTATNLPRVPQTKGNQPPTVLDAAAPQQIDSQLNPQQTFANFIEGASNRLSRSVGISIAEHPQSSQFNPMFVFGPSGCGKTHLINAIGVHTKQLFPQKRVLYISARLFQVQYTNAARQGTINDFINFYQTIDLLIVDDIQEWMTAQKTQDTFFHIFDHLFRNGKRIVLACDRPPVDLQGMNERLLTRFSCGLIAEVERPDPQLCVDILNVKIKHGGLDIPADVVNYIAATANGSVRDLEGVINSLLAHSVVYNCKVDMKLAERIIKRSVKVDNHPLTIDDILETVCQHYQVSTTAVNSKSRKRELVIPRQVSMYLAQKHTKMPAARIGKLVGGRDHSTVLHSCAQVEQRMKIDKKFCDEINSIENAFKLKR